jgi:hypothetical protein
LLLAVLLVWAIHRQVFGKEEADDIWISFKQHFRSGNWHWLWWNALLIPVNWFLETLKWRQLIKGFSDYSLWRTFQAILAGVSVGIFTPNRVGEYGGRVLLVKPEHNWRAVISTMVGSLAQMLILLSFGLIGAIYFATNYMEVVDQQMTWLLVVGGVGVLAMWITFYNIRRLLAWVKRFEWIQRFERYTKHLEVLTHYDARALSVALLYSFLRYLTYSTQYYFMLRFFDIDISLFVAYAGIATIYLIQSSIPLPPYLDLLARGEVALLIWSTFTTDEIAIFGSTFTLFIFNLIVPALFGMLIIFRSNIAQSLGWKKQSVE